MPRTSLSSAMLVPVMALLLVACGGSDDPVAEPYDSEWCVSARRLAAASSVMGAVDPTDPDAVEEAVSDMLAEAESAAPLAPAEIAADVEAALGSFREIEAALAAVDYDLLRADLSGVADDQGPSERVDAYNVEVCGLQPAADDEAPGGNEFDPAAGPIRDQLIETFVDRGFTAEQAGCIIDNVDVTDPRQMGDEQVLLDLIESCGIDLEQVTGTTGTTGTTGGDG